MDKWDYINKISKESNRYGDKLLALLDEYDKRGLRNITLNEAKIFWEELYGKN